MRLFSGTLKAGDKITVMSTNQSYEVKEVGVFTPEMTKSSILEEGIVGYVIAKYKDASEIQIGDTLTSTKNLHPILFQVLWKYILCFCGYLSSRDFRLRKTWSKYG